MKNKLFTLLFVVGVLACSKPTQESNEEINKVETGLVTPVHIEGETTWSMEERMKYYGVPGVSIAVIKDYKIAWVKSYGVMDKESKEPVVDQTLFQAGSISKPVAAYGVLRLVEQKKLDLESDVNTYLQSWKLPENEFTMEKKVALKHLLSHTGGVTVHGFPGYSPGLPVPTLVQILNGAAPANTAPISVDKLPEHSFRYSGGGYCVIQQMMIDVEGKPFPEIMDEQVLQPLEMKNSTYDQPLSDSQLKFAATGYLPDGSMTKGKRHTYPEMAAAGLWTTAEDLAKFAIDVQKTLQGESNAVLSQAMATKMLTPFVADLIGLGIFLEKRKDEPYFGHGGWDEGFSSHLVAHKNKGYGVVVLTNSNHPAFISEVQRAVALAYEWDNFVPVYKKLVIDPAFIQEVSGRYRSTSDGSTTISGDDGHLFRKFLRAQHKDELFKITDSTYITRNGDGMLQFKKNPDGQFSIVHLSMDGKPDGVARPRMKDDEKVPYEFLLADDFDQALKGYQALLKANPQDRSVNEEHLNSQGYIMMGSGKLDLAQAIFKVNMVLYPKSANVYDSYAEACMKNGDKEQAIANYKKSLAINPNNTHAKEMIAEME